MRTLPAVLISLALLAPTGGAVAAPAGDGAGPPKISADQMIAETTWHRIYPSAPDPIYGSFRTTMYAPDAKTCDSFAIPVRGTAGGTLSTFFTPNAKPNGLLSADQEVVRLRTSKAAARVVRLFRAYADSCVGNEQTDDGEGSPLLIKTRAWDTPDLADGTAGYLEGQVYGGSTSWERVLVVRVRRLVTVVSVSFDTVRPSAKSVVKAGREAVELLG